MDLSTLSLSELNKLQTQVSREIARRTQTAKRDLLKEIKKMAEEKGLSLDEVLHEAGGTEKPATRRRGPGRRKAGAAKKVGGKLPPKYRHPENAEIQWSGHGRRPQWAIDWLAAGKSLDDLLIQK